MAKARPKRKLDVRMTIKKFKQLEDFQRLQKHYQQQKLLRQMRDAQANADALEGFLANMHPHYRSAMPDVQARMKRFVDQTFHSGGVTGQAVVDAFPSSYQYLREVVKT